MISAFLLFVVSAQHAPSPEGSAQPQGTAPLVIDAVGACPTAAAVWDQLRVLGVSARSLRGRVRVVPAPEELSVELSVDDEPAARRVVGSPSTCEARAQTVALVIAAWLVDVPREFGGAPATEPVSTRPEGANPARALRAEPPRLQLGAALVGAVHRSGVSPGGRLELCIRPWARGPTLELAAALTRAREEALGAGQARWFRPMLMLSGGARLVDRAFALEVDAGPVVGALRVVGKGYDVNRTTRTGSVGGHAGARLLPRALQEQVWLDARMLGWLGPHAIRNELEPAGGGPALALPRWEAHVSVGVSLAIAP